MRDDGYNYISDGDIPDSSRPVWLESKIGCGIGFYKNSKWFWNKVHPVTKRNFEVVGKVICWKELEEKSNKEKKNE